MIRLALVDDEEENHKKLCKYIKKHGEKSGNKYNTAKFMDPSEILNNYRPIYDIIFMDVQMESMNGVEAANEIRKIDKDAIIIFVTNMADFAIQGYKVDALSYILKPVVYIDFELQLERAVKQVESMKTAFLIVLVNGEMIRIDISKIIYIESMKQKLLIHMEERKLEVYSTLKKVEKDLENYYFAKCNSGYLVNLNYVERVEKNTLFILGKELVISRSKKKDFMNELADYIGG